jgi:hypothetical protein
MKRYKIANCYFSNLKNRKNSHNSATQTETYSVHAQVKNYLKQSTYTIIVQEKLMHFREKIKSKYPRGHQPGQRHLPRSLLIKKGIKQQLSSSFSSAI